MVTINLDGFGLANRRQFAKLSRYTVFQIHTLIRIITYFTKSYEPTLVFLLLLQNYGELKFTSNMCSLPSDP